MINKIVACCLTWLTITAQGQEPPKLYTGVTVGLQHSSLRIRKSDDGFSNGAAFRSAFVLDYEITRRLSFQTQFGAQFLSAHSFTNPDKYKLLYPELTIGMNEYLPLGSGAFCMYVNVNAGYGLSLSTPSPFNDPGYKPFRAGWGLNIGYMLRNGLSFSTGVQSAFTNFYDNKGGFRVYESTLNILSIGYLHRSIQRSKGRRGK